MAETVRAWLQRYASAILVVFLAWLVRWLLDDVLGEHFPYGTFVLANILVAWHAGIGPSLMTLVIGALTAVYCFREPRASFLVITLPDQIGLLLYLVAGASISLLVRSVGTLWRHAGVRAAAVVARQVQLEEDLSGYQKAETSVKVAEEQLRLILDSVPALISYVDGQGRYRLNNRGYELWFGRERTEITGKHLREVLGEPAWEKIRPHIETVLSGQPVDYESTVPYKDGGARRIHASYVPQKNKEGEVMGFVALVQDITGRQQVEALEESMTRFRHIMETTSEGVWLLDSNARITFVNSRMAEMIGYSPADIVGCHMWDIVHEEDREDARELFERRRSGMIEQTQVRLIHRDGRTVWSMMAARPLTSDTGVFQGALEMFTDLSARKRAEEALRQSEERLRLIMCATNDAVWDMDMQTGLVWWNEAYEQRFGVYLPDPAEHYAWWVSHLHPEDRARVQASFEAAVAEGSSLWTADYRYQRADGSYAEVRDRGYIARDEQGRAVRALGTMLDITEHRRMEAALRDADRRKDEFLATLAHELRNPLAPIVNAVEILRALEPAGEELQRARGVIERQVQQMSRLVDDLLDLARVTQGKIRLHRERIDMAAAVLSGLEASTPIIERAGHELAVTLPAEPVWVDGDLTRLAQVLTNLLNNAAKYTEECGHIWVELAQEGEEAVIRVRDDGIGIPRDRLPTIFGMFTQVNRSLGRSQGGLGIGLTLVHKLVAMHGGTAEARSEGPGRGSEMVVRLPLAAADVGRTTGEQMEERAEVREKELPCHACRVLVVDDNADAADTLAMLLEVRGHEVHLAYSGAQALAVAGAVVPDVVLLDIGLPDLSGHEVARQMREQPALAHTLLVALTGWGQEEDRQQSRAAGFDHHLVKPVALEAVTTLLAQSRVARTRADEPRA